MQTLKYITCLKGSMELLERLKASNSVDKQIKDAVATLGYMGPASWLSSGRALSIQQMPSGDTKSIGSWSSIGMRAFTYAE